MPPPGAGRDTGGRGAGREPWQEGAEDLEDKMQRIRREEASPEDLNRTLDPVLGDAEEEELEPGMKIGGLAFEGWPVDKKGDAGAKEMKAFFMHACDLDTQQKKEVNEANVRFERKESREKGVFSSKVTLLNEKGDSALRYIFMNLKQMMQQHGVRMTCLEAKEIDEHEEQTELVSDLMKKLTEVRSMIKQAEENQLRDEAQIAISTEEGVQMLTDPTNNPRDETEAVNEVRVRVSMGSAVQDPELGERGEEEVVEIVVHEEAEANAEEDVNLEVLETDQEEGQGREMHKEQDLNSQSQTHLSLGSSPRLHEFFSDWKRIDKRAKDFKRKREEEIREKKKNKGANKNKATPSKEKVFKKKEKIVTSTPKDKEAEKGVEGDVESEARADEEEGSKKEGRESGAHRESKKCEKLRRCGRCEACNKKCKMCEESTTCRTR